MSRVYSLKAIQVIPADINQVWSFFCNPANLKDITPVTLAFNVISRHHGNVIYPGQIIEYTVRPVFNIPLYWMTEITHVADKKFFVDEQRYGPYSLWHHQHHFKETANGVEMIDIVHYKIPFWFIGDIANRLFVRRQLQKIFSFRFKAVQDRFGKWPGQNEHVVLS